MSKLKRENLEEDLLIEYSSRFLNFYNNNKVAVISAGVGLVLVVGLIIGYYVYSTKQEQEAENLMGIAEQELLQGNYQQALEGSEEDLTLGFVQIAENYSHTNAGNLANYYSAVCEYQLGNYDEALNYIEQYSPPEGILGVAPISLYANILIELEKYDDAATQFERAAHWDENDSTTPYNLFKAAEAHIEAGNKEQAQANLEAIINDYPNSQQAGDAERLQGTLVAEDAG